MTEPRTTPCEDALELLRQTLGDRLDPTMARLTPDELRDLVHRLGVTPEKPTPPSSRWQDEWIEHLVPEHSSVLDLGCGEGLLLERLAQLKQVRGQGVELDANAVEACVARGVPIMQADLDRGLQGFPDGLFDIVVLEETLQTLRNPQVVLREMLRVGRCGLVSFPNFGCWRIRLELALTGRMPVSSALPHTWYETPNIHLMTLLDFEELAAHEHFTITRGYALVEGCVRPLAPGDNLAAEEVLLEIRKRA
ncbi:MAG: methionine biosynthesis protein MetW [Kiritimatiellae bacterium]|nr:methionine biosynthesis protein MetW [Kiritimatiellia bacterium]